MSTQGFFTGSIIAKNRLLRPYPQMGTDLIVRNASVGNARTHALELSGQKRFAQGYNFNVGYTWLSTRSADIFFNPFDPTPTWRESNDGRPHRFTATGIVQLPFGKGRLSSQAVRQAGSQAVGSLPSLTNLRVHC